MDVQELFAETIRQVEANEEFCLENATWAALQVLGYPEWDVYDWDTTEVYVEKLKPNHYITVLRSPYGDEFIFGYTDEGKAFLIREEDV